MRKRSIGRNVMSYVFCSGMVFGYGAYAQSEGEALKQDVNWNTFSKIDRNADQELEWLEIHRVYEDELREAGWGETALMNEFDENRSGTIDMQEYVVVLSNLITQPTTRQAALNERSVRGPDDKPVDKSARGPQGQREDIVQNAEPVPGRFKDITVDTPETAPIGTATRLDTPDKKTAGAADAADTAQQQPLEESIVRSFNGMSLDEIQQLPVLNMNRQKLGQVDDVVLRQDGAEAGIVVTIDGDDTKDKNVFVDRDQFSVTEEAILWQTPLDSEGVKQLPEYNEALYVSVL